MNTVAALSFSYNPNRLFDTLRDKLGLAGDGALSRKLKLGRNALAALRAGRVPVGASLLLWIQDATGIAVEDMRAWLGDRRVRMRPACVLTV